VVAEVNCLSSWHIFYVSHRFLFVSCGVDSECSDIQLLKVHRLYGVDNDGNEGVCTHLEQLLCVHVDPGEPAPETRVGMVPPDDVVCVYFAHPLRVGCNESVGLVIGSHSCL